MEKKSIWIPAKLHRGLVKDVKKHNESGALPRLTIQDRLAMLVEKGRRAESLAQELA